MSAVPRGTGGKSASLVVLKLQKYTQAPQRAAALGLFLGLLLFALPLLWVQDGSVSAPTPSVSPLPLPAAHSPAPVQTYPGSDAARLVRVLLEDGSVEEQTMADYLWRVVAAEMPASFHPDALCAQAVCARTYTLASGRHSNADVCTSSACCQAYLHPDEAAARWGDANDLYRDKIAAAVSATDGVVAAHQGSPIQAVFFSSSTAWTEDAVAVWGSQLPYLVSVPSPEGEGVPNYTTTVTLSAEEVSRRVLAFRPQADLSGPAESWFTGAAYTQSGRVATLTVGGISLTGGEARTLFGLRSTCFTLTCGADGFVFSVTGYGHGVGMSQYGANTMAEAGTAWPEILTHYYTGITLEKGW